MMEEVGNVDLVDKVNMKVGHSHHTLPYTYIPEDLLSWKFGQLISVMKGYLCHF